MSERKEIRKPTYVVRLDDDGQLDELLAKNVSIHLERMDGNQWWMGIELPDGMSLMLNFGCVSRRSRLKLLLQEDDLNGVSYEAEGDGVKP